MLDIPLHSIFHRNAVIITTKNEDISVSVNDNALMFPMPEIQTKIKLVFRTQGWLTRALCLPLVIIHLFISYYASYCNSQNRFIRSLFREQINTYISKLNIYLSACMGVDHSAYEIDGNVLSINVLALFFSLAAISS